jgi:tetratricopeptide (TPR) repeat protein
LSLIATLDRWLAQAVLRALLLLGARDLALQQAQRQIARNPGNRHALATRAHLLVAQGKARQALADLERLVQLAPKQASAWFNLGFVQESLSDTPAAAESFCQAVRMEPGMDRAWYGLALCRIRQGRWDDAVIALKHNTALQPMSPHGWYQLARVHLERGEAEAAHRVLQHLHSFEPKVAAQLQRETSLRVSGG